MSIVWKGTYWIYLLFDPSVAQIELGYVDIVEGFGIPRLELDMDMDMDMVEVCAVMQSSFVGGQ